MKTKIVYFAILLFSLTAQVQAQKDRTQSIIWSSLHGLEYELKAGINIGGTSPLPLPEEIRALTGYSPNLNFSIEGNVTKWLGKTQKWGVRLGMRIENKDMEANARTKNYSMEIIGDGGEHMAGNWTGRVKTNYHSSLFSVPVLATYQLNKRVNLSAGPYFSFLLNGTFDGYVYDGYLRQGNPTGTKAEFKGDSTAPYDFSDDLRTFQYGVEVGAAWRAFKRLTVHADLTWGLNDIFKKDFNTITFAMYPIYLNVGFGYAF